VIPIASGLPYKSNAKIKQPASGKAFLDLLAADDGFWYAADSTPNEIPVVSLFQDIHYSHIIFCKHVARVTNTNGEETAEPYIKNIVTYNTDRRDSELTACNTYFSVPIEVDTAHWVAKDGNDGTGDGSKTNPWLTISKAETEDAGTVYIKSGTYAEDINIDVGRFTAVGVGYVNVSAITTAAVVNTTDNLVTVQHLILNKGSTAYWLRTWSLDSCTLDMCQLNGGTLIRAPSEEIYIKNSVWNPAGLNRIEQGTFDGNLIYGSSYTGVVFTVGNTTTSAAEVDFIYNDFDLDWASGTRAVFQTRMTMDLNISHNHFDLYYAYLFSPYNEAFDIDLTFRYNDVDMDNTATQCFGIFTASEYTGSANITNNDFNITENAGRSIHFNNANVTPVNIDSNRIYSDGDYGGIYIEDISHSGVLTIRENEIILDGDDNNILVGDPTEAGQAWATTIDKNKIVGPWASDTSIAAAGHAIFITSVPNAKIRYNHISYYLLGVVYKGDGLENDSAIVSYNIVENCYGSYLSKGAVGVKFYNNTAYREQGALSPNRNFYGIQVLKNIDNDKPGSECELKNNIIYCTTTDGDSYGIVVADAVSEVGFDSDYNLIKINNGVFYDYKGTDKTFAEIKAEGYETNSIEANPLFETGTVIPSSSSQALGNGYTIGSSHISGLNSLSVWPSAVVLKNQSTSWDIGAYIISE